MESSASAGSLPSRRSSRPSTNDDAHAVVRKMRERSEWILERFRELEPGSSEGFIEDVGERFPHLALLYGIGLMEWIAGWARETERALEGDGLS